MRLKLKNQNIADYVQQFINSLFKESLEIKTKKQAPEAYIVNEKLEYPVYEFWKKTDQELIDDFNNNCFKKDPIGTIFFFLSGYWEYKHDEEKDRFGRFQTKNAFQYIKNIIEEPIVDILTDEIKKELNLTYKREKSTISITHDIDNLESISNIALCKKLTADAIIRKDLKLAFERYKNHKKNKANFSAMNLIKFHQNQSFKPIFFIMPEEQGFKIGGGYDPEKNKAFLNKLIQSIKKINGEIGIHYDFRHLRKNRLKKDIEKLENLFNLQIQKGRAHYLIFDITKSFKVYEQAGIKNDFSGGYSDLPGFRFGTSHPFKPYNFEETKVYNLLETPLIIMDVSLRSRERDYTPKEGLKKIFQIKEKVDRYKGVFTILWHNTAFYYQDWGKWEEVLNCFIDNYRESVQ